MSGQAGVAWQYFPKSRRPPQILLDVIEVFTAQLALVGSTRATLDSNAVLLHVAPGLRGLGFDVERGKRAEDRIRVPVLFGRNGRPEKVFDADAFHPVEGVVLEVEAGRAIANNQILKDFFQACMMYNVRFCVIAVRNTYGTPARPDFDTTCTFFETMYASGRLEVPLDGLLIIGY